MQLLSLRYKSYLIPALLVPIALSIYITQIHIERHKGVEQRIEEFMLLPKGEYLKPAVIGYEQLVGDIIRREGASPSYRTTSLHRRQSLQSTSRFSNPE